MAWWFGGLVAWWLGGLVVNKPANWWFGLVWWPRIYRLPKPGARWPSGKNDGLPW